MYIYIDVYVYIYIGIYVYINIKGIMMDLRIWMAVLLGFVESVSGKNI